MGCTEFFSEIIVEHTGTYNKGVLTGQMTNGRPFCLMKHFSTQRLVPKPV